MLNNQKQSEAARNIFGSSLIGLANTLAVVCTFLVTPTLYGRTIDWVQRYTALNYPFCELPQYQSGRWRYVEGFKPR